MGGSKGGDSLRNMYFPKFEIHIRVSFCCRGNKNVNVRVALYLTSAVPASSRMADGWMCCPQHGSRVHAMGQALIFVSAYRNGTAEPMAWHGAHPCRKAMMASDGPEPRVKTTCRRSWYGIVHLCIYDVRTIAYYVCTCVHIIYHLLCMQYCNIIIIVCVCSR